MAPNVLVTEVTFGNANEARADEAGHLTPALLREALVAFRRERGNLPKGIVSHMNPPWEATIRKELNEVAEQLGAEILISHSDMKITL